MTLVQLISAGLRALASVAPLLIESGKASVVSRTLDNLADLGERGEAAFNEVRADLEQLVDDLKAMDGVSAEDREAVMRRIEDRSQRIQNSVEDLRPPQPETD